MNAFSWKVTVNLNHLLFYHFHVKFSRFAAKQLTFCHFRWCCFKWRQIWFKNTNMLSVFNPCLWRYFLASWYVSQEEIPAGYARMLFLVLHQPFVTTGRVFTSASFPECHGAELLPLWPKTSVQFPLNCSFKCLRHNYQWTVVMKSKPF